MKQKVLIVNKFYYPRGGDCIAALSLEQLLRDKGHEVAVFSMQHPENLPSPWEKYFPSSVDFSGNAKDKLRAAQRIFHSNEVEDKFNRLLDDFKPDVVHLHNIHSYLSPLVVELASKRGIKTVWTMHDYKLICPTYLCLRKGKPCELCFKEKWNVVKTRCMKDSFQASLIAYFEAKYWNRNRLEKVTDSFITPGSFLKENMIKAGFCADKIHVIHNFMHSDVLTSSEKEDYYCYVGRLSEEKGIDNLLAIAAQIPNKLLVIGGGELLQQYKSKYEAPNISFMGQIPNTDALKIMQKARFLVVPSVCYENSPFSIIEAHCNGTPVIGARIGGIPELIDEGKDGLLFKSGDEHDLLNVIKMGFNIFNESFDYKNIASNAQNKYSKDSFYEKIIDTYGGKTQ